MPQSLSCFVPLERKCRHFDEIVIAGCTKSCQDEELSLEPLMKVSFPFQWLTLLSIPASIHQFIHLIMIRLSTISTTRWTNCMFPNGNILVLGGVMFPSSGHTYRGPGGRSKIFQVQLDDVRCHKRWHTQQAKKSVCFPILPPEIMLGEPQYTFGWWACRGSLASECRYGHRCLWLCQCLSPQIYKLLFCCQVGPAKYPPIRIGW